MPKEESKSFSAKAMNDVWDLSNDDYPAMLQKHRQIEAARAAEQEERRRQQQLWRRLWKKFGGRWAA